MGILVRDQGRPLKIPYQSKLSTVRGDAMNCGCHDYDQPRCGRDAWRMACIDHQCGECGAEIRRGERYRLFEGLNDEDA